MRIFAIDPGFTVSALVIYDGRTVLEHAMYQNGDLLTRLAGRQFSDTDVLVIEQIASFGMPVGAEVFETCVWSGRFLQAWVGSARPFMPCDRLTRHTIKLHLCRSARAKDSNIRQALIDRFGPSRERAMGTKAQPGPLFGVAGDEWSALAVAVSWWDGQRSQQKAG